VYAKNSHWPTIMTPAESYLARFAKRVAEEQARQVDPATLSAAIEVNIEAQSFCYWVRLSVFANRRITPVLRSCIDEKYPGFLECACSEVPMDDLAIWQALQEWISTHVFDKAAMEGWRDALGYYTAAAPSYKKVSDLWHKTQDALESGRLRSVPPYELWRDSVEDH